MIRKAGLLVVAFSFLVVLASGCATAVGTAAGAGVGAMTGAAVGAAEGAKCDYNTFLGANGLDAWIKKNLW